jgi:hypothetical protein
VVFLLVLAINCGQGSPTAPGSPFVSVNQNVVTVSFDFRDGLHEWVGEFAPARWPSSDVPIFESRLLPAPLDTSRRAFYMLGGTSGGLRLAKRRVAGIPVNRSFSARFNIELATSTPTGCLTAFGPVPVAQAFANATVAEPVPASDSSGLLRPEWTAPGSASLGVVTNGATCGSSSADTWARTTLSGTVALVTPDAGGRVWLSFEARDSSYEGIRVDRPLYLTRYDVILTPR